MSVRGRHRFRRSVRHGLVLMLVLASTVPGFSQKFKVSAYVDRGSVGLNEQFELSIELSGSDANGAPQPAPPTLDKFASYLGSRTSTNMQFINGRMSVTATYSYTYLAHTVGKFQIPPIQYDYRGQRFSTDAIAIEVLKSPAAAQQPRQGRPLRSQGRPQQSEETGNILFLRAVPDKNVVYQNEPVVVSYKLYFAANVTNYGLSQMPSTVGFWSEDFELPARPRIYSEVVDGQQFRVAEIKKTVLFAQGPGEKTLGPLTAECEVQVKRRRRRGAFDSFFDDPFFGFDQTVRKSVASNSVKIKVLPLPSAGRPSDFSGAVGAFTIKASVDKTTVKANEAVTLKVVIAGSGNIKMLPAPNVQFPGDFETYDPKVTEHIQRKSSRLSGDKTFEYVMIPRFPGKQSIRPIRFSFFDVASKRYRSVATPAMDIVVTKGARQFVATGLGTSKEDVKFIGQDIHFIQVRLPEFKQMSAAFYKSWPFFLLLGLPLLALAGASFYQRYQRRLSSNVAYARRRKANQMAIKCLRKARGELKNGDPKQFYAEVSTALMGFIGDKLNVSAAGLITDEAEEMLKARGIDDKTVESYLGCLRTCDFKRFAPGDSKDVDMQALLGQAKQAIVSLEKAL